MFIFLSYIINVLTYNCSYGVPVAVWVAVIVDTYTLHLVPEFSEYIISIFLQLFFFSTSAQNCFDFPTDLGYDVSEEAKELMRQLICSSEFRLGKNGINDFKVRVEFNKKLSEFFIHFTISLLLQQ